MNRSVNKAPSRPFRVLFVCSGNTCRSPMAELLFRVLVAEGEIQGVEARSAGTHAHPDAPASEGASSAVRRHGHSLEAHRSTQLSPELLEWADLILAMGPGHLQLVQAMGEGERAALLGAFAHGAEPGSVKGADPTFAVPDPFGGDEAMYEATYETLAGYLSRVVARLDTTEEE